MQRLIVLILSLFMPLMVSANVLDKVHLEEAVQNRLEKNLKAYDKDLRVVLRFVYRAPEPLPGTAFLEDEGLEPNTIGEADIRSINIEVHTRLPELSQDMQNDIYAFVPVRKSRIRLKHMQIVEKPIVPHVPLKSKDLWDITNFLAEGFSKLLLGVFGGSLFLLFGLVIYMHRSGMRQWKENIQTLANAFSESSGSNTTNSYDTTSRTSTNESYEASKEGELTLPMMSIKELLADSYWCKEDGYAHWLWKKLSAQQKQELLNAWPTLKKYSLYFVGVKATEKDFHDHPYYLAPENLFQVSQEALVKEVKTHPDLWLSLSPMRQKSLSIPISEKLRVVQKGAAKTLPKLSVVSPERELPSVTAFGDLSFADESAIMQNPKMVPDKFKSQVRSLVWLCFQEPAYIEATLAKFDARSLASAWIGAPEVLQVLEQYVPEKKMKMLKSYKEQLRPSRQSASYQALVDAGCVQNAA